MATSEDPVVVRWLDEMHKAQFELNDLAIDISQISQNFHNVGNDYVYGQLKEIGLELEKINKDIGIAVNAMLIEEVHRGQRQMTDIFMSILSAISSESEEQPALEEA